MSGRHKSFILVNSFLIKAKTHAWLYINLVIFLAFLMVSSMIGKYLGSQIFSSIKSMQWAAQGDQKKVSYLCCKTFPTTLNAASLSLRNWTIFSYPTSLTTSSNISSTVSLSFRRPEVSTDFKNMVHLGE